jgi:argininosuccinate lyase
VKTQKQEEYKGYWTAGVRLTQEMAPSVMAHQSSDEVKHRLYAIHMFDKAHLVMLTEEGLIPRQDGCTMLRELRKMEEAGVETVRMGGGDDVSQGGKHSGERYLIRQLGESIGGRIHLGRSSGDLTKVSTRILIRDKLLILMGKIIELRQVLIDLAGQHLDTVMPGYTFAQHAQPTTWGHVLLSWVSVLERDFDRLHETFVHANCSPAGAAIYTGSDFPLNRHRVAELLGFFSVEKNTFDAILSDDGFLEVVSALAILHMNLARWSDDLILFSTSEFNMIEFPDRFCGTSSIMPQKKNAVAPCAILGAAPATVGGLVTAFMVEQNPTGVPFEGRQYAREAIIQNFERLARDLDSMIEFMPALRVNKNLMLERAGAFWAQAADVASALVREKGLPWRTAHQIVGILVRFTYERNIKPTDVTPELLDEAAIEYMSQPVELEPEILRDALDPVVIIHRRTLYGGPAPQEVRQRLTEYKDMLAEDVHRLASDKERVSNAAVALEEAIDSLLML